MVAMKRKRTDREYSEDDKLLHQATKSLTKEVKRVKTFLLQQAIRKSKAQAVRQSPKNTSSGSIQEASSEISVQQECSGGAATDKNLSRKEIMEDEPTGGVAGVADFTRVGGACGPSKTTGADEAVVESRKGALISSAAREVVLIKGFQPLTVVKLCLRRLGLAHTGPAGEDEVKIEESDHLHKLTYQVFEHKRVTQVMDEFQKRVTQRRREKLAASEGRSLPGQGRAAKGRGKKKSNATEGGGGQSGGKRSRSEPGVGQAAMSTGSAFISLSGEAPSDEEWASAPRSKNNTKDNKNARYKPDAQPSSAPTTASNKKRKGFAERSATEPGWAGAERAAGWGRGGGRSKNGGIGKAGARPSHESDSAKGDSGVGRRAGGGRGVGGERGREGRGVRGGTGAEARGGGGGGGGGDREDSSAGVDLHGSWAAKRALKEKEASATKAFSGKRIVFGDDD